MAEYVNHYILTSPGVQIGGEMDAFFSLIRDSSGNLVRTASINPYDYQSFYVRPPYTPQDASRAGGNQIVVIGRTRTGFGNPFANAIIKRAYEWNALNPSRRTWTNTMGDDRPIQTTPAVNPQRQAYIDNYSAGLINQALENAVNDFYGTFTEEYLRILEAGMMIYYLTEDYETAVVQMQNDLNTLNQNLPYYEKTEPPSGEIPMTIRFAPLTPEINADDCAVDFGEQYCGILRNAAINGSVNIGDTVCLVAKDADAEKRVLDLLDRHNESPEALYIAAATYDDYCRESEMKCGQISEKRCTYDTFDTVVMA